MPPVQMTRSQFTAKYGVAPMPSAAPTSTPASPTAAPNSAPVKMSRADYQAKYGATPDGSPAPAPDQGGGFLNTLGHLGKDLISAPATIIARPFQAVAELAGASPEAVDKFSKDHLGGIVAPVPQNAGDVKKDVGRGIETVALGTGAPIAGGAAFGLGGSLEQGNDLLSTQTLFNTVLGAGAGKVLDLVGKPLLNAAGKVVGTITPQVLKDVASGGADAVAKFAATHDLLGGIAKPLSEKIATGAEAIDKNVNKLFTGVGNAAKTAVTSQYPGLSKEGMQTHFQNVDQANFSKPAEKPGYMKAKEIFDNAKAQGTDLSKVAVDNGIQHDTLIEDKKYNTSDTADAVRNDAMKTSHDLIRPALAAAEPGVANVPIADVRAKMMNQVNNIPKSQLTDAERAIMKSRIMAEFGDNSPAALAHPDGYKLTDLHDQKIATSGNAKFKTNGTPSENFPARVAKVQSDAFRTLLEQNAPAELKIRKFNQAIQQKFQLADYLDSLHGKKVPQGIVRKSISLFGKVLGASLGGEVGGGLGGVVGYHLGGVLFNSFDNLSNPLKAAYLNSIEKTQPEIFNTFKKYLGDQKTQRLMRPLLNAGDKMKANLPAIELGPKTTPPANTIGNNITQNSRRLFNTPQLPAGQDVPILPNKSGAPNVTLQVPGSHPQSGEIGGMRQRLNAYYEPKPKPKK